MAICGAKAKSSGKPCKKPAGWGTKHLGSGRCKLHGGATPSGPDSPHFKHGRYANAFKGTFKMHFDAAMAEGQPMDLLPELAAQRAMLHRYIETVSGRKRTSLKSMETVVSLAETIAKTAVRIVDAHNKTALTNAELNFVLGGMKQVLEKYVPDPDQRRAFINDLRQFIPGQLDAGTKADG